MTILALSFVLLAALTHASWNIYAKVAAESRHFVWLFSAGSVLIYGPVVVAVLIVERPVFESRHWLALAATSVLHLLYSLSLQTGYRHSDLSVVYPIARGTGPLLSFIGAGLLLGEAFTAQSVAGMLLIVGGILLVAGLVGHHRRAPGVGVFYGLLTGALISAYTLNDGWAVKVLLISPFVIDFTGNLFRMLVLAPRAWRDRARVALEARTLSQAGHRRERARAARIHLGLVCDAPRADQPRRTGTGVVDTGGRVVRFAVVARGFGSLAHRRCRAHRRRRHQPGDSRLRRTASCGASVMEARNLASSVTPAGRTAAPGELGKRQAQLANARRLP